MRLNTISDKHNEDPQSIVLIKLPDKAQTKFGNLGNNLSILLNITTYNNSIKRRIENYVCFI